jgi:glycosyltransferase involved in cell wall biosynthesis
VTTAGRLFIVHLAWFTPWPPQTSGVAGRSVDVTRELAARGYAIDVFVDRQFVPATMPVPDGPAADGEVRVQSAHDFVWRRQRGHHDVVVYQVGNSTAHTFIWPYLLRYPGVVMLHDAHLHHSRGAALLTPVSGEAYRAAFAADHPDVNADVAELDVVGFDGSYYYLWPMVGSAIRSSRAVAVHARGNVDRLRVDFPTTPIEYVALGMGRERATSERERSAFRASCGIPADALLFGLFGGLTADKRVPQVLRAFARLRTLEPRAHLLLAGWPDPRVELPQTIAALGLGPAVTVAPNLDDEAFEDAIGSVDVSLNLRWPTARETSGPWVQALAASRPTVVIDLEHHAHVPALDPQSWIRRPGTGLEPPIAVALDILDEEHSLGLAMSRLARDPELRATLGAAARQFWEREHSVSRMADDYDRMLRRVHQQSAHASPHAGALTPDPLRHARELVSSFGELRCTLF